MSKIRYRQVHLDFHTSEYIPDIAADFDKEEFAKTFSKKQMEAICHAGRNDRSYLDLWRANRIILEEAGVQPQNISVTNICTRCNPDLLYSHRIMGAQRGNLAAVLMIKE